MQLLQTGFFAILLSMGLYGFLHSIMASHGGKDIMRWVLGESFYQHWYRLFYNFVAVLTLLPVAWLLVTSPDQPLWSLPGPWNTIFRLIQLGGVLAVTFAVMQTGALTFAGISQILSDGKSGEPTRLVTSGLYRLVRHPIYTFSLVVLWFSPTFTVNSLAFAIGATAYFLIGMVFEERKLSREFGESYLDYQQKTPALIPGLKMLVPSPVRVRREEDR